jgi:hypothetical protein
LSVNASGRDIPSGFPGEVLGSLNTETIMNKHPEKASVLRKRIQQFGLAGLPLSFFSGNSFAGSVNLAWDASTSANVGGYIVSYGQGGAKDASSIDVGNKTAFTIVGLQEGGQYYFRVKAYDSNRTIESAYSNELSATVPVTTAVKAGGVPSGMGIGGLWLPAFAALFTGVLLLLISRLYKRAGRHRYTFLSAKKQIDDQRQNQAD